MNAQPSASASGKLDHPWKELTRVDHVCHITQSLEIVKAGKIRPGLVYDESKLNTERIQVIWASPNHWYPGFRYGNVRFSFDWASLIDGMNFYWVERMDIYSPPASRILLTRNKYDGKLERYDPSKGGGPWRCDSAGYEHFWKGDQTLEIMVDSELLIQQCLNIDFVKHHEQFCNIAPSACPDFGLSKDAAQSLFLALVVGRSINPKNLGWVNSGEPGEELGRAFRELLVDLGNHSEDVPYYDGLESRSPEASAIIRSILSFLGVRKDADVKSMLVRFGSLREVRKSCAMEVASSFGLSDWRSLKP